MTTYVNPTRAPAVGDAPTSTPGTRMPQGRGSQSLEDRFWRFHETNPQVFLELVRLARRAHERGCRKVGIKMLWEVMRWNLTVETRREDGDDFKLNNNLPSRYARLIMGAVPELAELFEVRELKTLSGFKS